jgi:hypothetical protein
MVIVFSAEHVEEGTETVATFEFWGWIDCFWVWGFGLFFSMAFLSLAGG